MKRPLHHVDECGECHGEGGTSQEDWDGEAPRKVLVACEFCDSCGSTTSCDACGEGMPLTEAETNGYVCGPCLADFERTDAQAEISRIRRWSA